MTITDEMVEAALREWSRPNDARSPSVIMRAALEAADAAAWQPIETAPTTGGWVMLGRIGCQFDGEPPRWRSVSLGYWNGVEWSEGLAPSGHAKPTHWRTSPAAPKGGA